jgi:protein TonB
MATRRHIGPLLVSLTAHAVAIALVIWATGALVPELTEPMRLVFVEPPPPPPPASGTPGGAGTSATAVPAPVVPVAPVAPPKPKAKPVPAPVAKPRPVPKPVASAEPRPPRAGTGAGDEAGSRRGTSGGTAGGVGGGVVGGSGQRIPRASEVATPPVVVRRVSPRYPRQARAAGTSGLVLLEAVLDREGRVEERIKVVRSIPMLDEAAIEALRQWRFRPARDQHRQAVRVVLEVPMRFVLE